MPRPDNSMSGFTKAIQQEMGLPEGFTISSPFPFGGLNLQDSRAAMPDNEFYARENFIRIGNGNLRTLWDKGGSLYTVVPGRTIVYFFFYNIGATNYVAIFLDNGTAIQVNTSTRAETVISNVAGRFYNGTTLPACVQSGSQYLLISNNISQNNYWIWDGDTLFAAGTLSPKVTVTSGGSGYTSAPTVTSYGGSGSGATFTATIGSGSVISVAVDSPGSGYQPNDQVQLRFSGGGSDNGAQLTAVLVTGSVQTIIITDGGVGYTSPIVAITGGGGSGATATATESGGIVDSITVTAGGSGYTSTPTVTITDGGPGAGATAVATLTPGKVSSVTVVNGGTGFTSTPTITFVGGGGTGAAGTVTLTGGVITSVAVTNQGSGYTSPPAVVVASGFNRSAAATVSLMPFGVSGSSIETFQQRVWLAYPNQVGNQQNGGTFLVSAPGSLTNFATSAGGLVFVSTDSTLRAQYTNIKQTNGYLYPFGDSSISVISNVQTTGSPSTTTFNYQNTDPQIGATWRDSCSPYSRTILFANPIGCYGLYGGAVTKISQKIDDLFNNALFPPTADALTPSSAVANIFQQKVYLTLVTVGEKVFGVKRNIMIAWDEKEWFIATQTIALIQIGTQEVSSNLVAWGTDGTDLFPMFQQPSSSLNKRISSKLYGVTSPIVEKQAFTFMTQCQDLTADNEGVELNVDINTETRNIPLPYTPVLSGFYPTTKLYSAASGDIYGVNIGFTIDSTSPDFSIQYVGISHAPYQGLLSSSGDLST